MSDSRQILSSYIERTRRFREDAHSILGVHEESKSRVVLLDSTYARLKDLSVSQDELFRQALRCIESDLYRAAHVMGWAAFMDFLEEKICEDGLTKLNSLRPKWKVKSIEELREKVNEFQIIDSARELGLCSKSQGKALHGLLNKRNECAHPSDFFPNLNETLGYLSELFTRVEQIGKRAL